MVDVGLEAETEPMTNSSRYVRPYTSAPLQSFRTLSARSILRVTPHIAQRPLVEPTPALKSLLIGAQLSHYNYLKGSIRTPQKQDYFHEKTLIYNFQPSFRASYFAHMKFELPKDMHKTLSVPQFVPTEASKCATSRPRKRVRLTPPAAKPSTSAPKPKTAQLQRTFTTSCFHFNSLHKTSKPKPRPIICVQDGETLAGGTFKTYLIDFLDYVQKYIGFVPSPNPEPLRSDEVSLKHQALMELLEKTNVNLRPAKPFVAIFTVDGRRLEDLALVPLSCKVLIFSSTGEFKGLRD